MNRLMLFFLMMLSMQLSYGQAVVRYGYDVAGNRINRAGTTSTTVAQWTFTGNTRCMVNNNNVNTGNIEREEKDNNAGSSTYNQVRWVLSGFSTTTCPLPAGLMATGNFRSQLDANFNPTGYQEIELVDGNPGSTTFNQTKWVVSAYNGGSTTPLQCDDNSCVANGPAYRCIYGKCELGYKIYTSSENDSTRQGVYNCSYHYEWSDGSISQEYTEQNTGRCY